MSVIFNPDDINRFLKPEVRETEAQYFERLKRKFLQAVERERASQYADPIECLEGHVSFERSLPLSEWTALNRVSRSREDVWTDYHNLD